MSDPTPCFAFEGFRLYPGRRQLCDPEGATVALRAKPFDLLVHLVRQRGEVVGKTELMELLWPGMVVEENNLSQAVATLRQALGDSAQSPRFIATVTGRGYQFVADVKTESEAATSPEAPPEPRPWLWIAAGLLVASVVGYILWPGGDSGDASGAPVVADFAAADTRLVTDYEGAHSDAALSPDGSMLAWIADDGDVPQLWVRNLGSREPLQLTDGRATVSAPNWTPDARLIVYASESDAGNSIYAVSPLGGEAPRLLVDAADDPGFSAGVDQFAFARGRSVYLYDMASGTVRPVGGIPEGPGFAIPRPALSPDGSMIAFLHADAGPIANLWVVPSDGGDARQLTRFSIPDMLVADGPAWLPDGRQIVYSRVSRGLSSDLWVADIETGENRPLSTGPAALFDPSVTRDGRTLSYTSVRAEWMVTRVDPDSGERIEISRNRYPVTLPLISPDGTTLVYFSMTGDGLQVFTTGLDGANTRQWTYNTPGSNTLPFWSSDGQSIFYYRGASLHQVDIDEGRDRQVIADFHWSSRNWADHSGSRLYYHEFDVPTRKHRAVVRDLETDEEWEFDRPIVSGQWSRDGALLVGRDYSTGHLSLCGADFTCREIVSDGEPVRGLRPKWSRDGDRIFFLRFAGNDSCCELMSVPALGGPVVAHISLPGYDVNMSYHNVDADGWIVYNSADRSDDEIWIATVGRVDDP